jgi:predicted enzyme related to lactoylglutathione lyase
MDEDAGQIGFVFPESDAEIVIHTDVGIPNPDFSFLVDDVAAFCEDYERQGCRVARKPFDVRCGKFAVLEDPDGNPIPIVDLTRFNESS